MSNINQNTTRAPVAEVVPLSSLDGYRELDSRRVNADGANVGLYWHPETDDVIVDVSREDVVSVRLNILDKSRVLEVYSRPIGFIATSRVTTFEEFRKAESLIGSYVN
jgi:hypothetical protein